MIEKRKKNKGSNYYASLLLELVPVTKGGEKRNPNMKVNLGRTVFYWAWVWPNFPNPRWKTLCRKRKKKKYFKSKM